MQEEKIVFHSADGTELVGILAMPEELPKTCIVLCHGITGTKDENQIFVLLTQALVEKGFAVFRFDFRGHGESGGRPQDMTISGEKEDVTAAFALLKKKGFTTFGLLGASFAGGVVSLYTADHVKEIKALGLWNPLLDYGLRLDPRTSWGKKYWGQSAVDRVNKLGYTEIDSFFRVGKKLMDEMAGLEPWKALVELEIPTLFVHGNRDEDIDYHDSVKYSLLMKYAQLEIIRGAGHGFGNSEEHEKEAVEKTVAFFVEHL